MMSQPIKRKSVKDTNIISSDRKEKLLKKWCDKLRANKQAVIDHLRKDENSPIKTGTTNKPQQMIQQFIEEEIDDKLTADEYWGLYQSLEANLQSMFQEELVNAEEKMAEEADYAVAFSERLRKETAQKKEQELNEQIEYFCNGGHNQMEIDKE